MVVVPKPYRSASSRDGRHPLVLGDELLDFCLRDPISESPNLSRHLADTGDGAVLGLVASVGLPEHRR